MTADCASELLRLEIAAVNGRYGNTDTPARSVVLRGKKRQPPTDRTGGTQIILRVFGGTYDYTTLRSMVEGHLRVGQGPAALAHNVAAIWDARVVAHSQRDGRRNTAYVVRVTPLSNSPHDVMLRAMGIKVETPDGGSLALVHCRQWECSRCVERVRKLRERRRTTRDEENTPFSHTELHPEGECARAWRRPERDEATQAERAARSEERPIAIVDPEAGGVAAMEEGETEAAMTGGAEVETTGTAAAAPPGDWEVVGGRGRAGGVKRLGPLKTRALARELAGGHAAPGSGPEGPPPPPEVTGEGSETDRGTGSAGWVECERLVKDRQAPVV